MTTSYTNTLALLFLALLAVVSAGPVLKRDVFVPPVTYPREGTVWKAGSKHNVTWDVSNPPKQITNNKGMIILSKGGILQDLDDPLAENFNILDGRHEITVPDVAAGDDYAIVVFGDSGNASPDFTITN
ncbi:hypothetical protein PsYK624_048860 [Phanerochaete sordida]|uniref:Yeast cell wall synthesis Kre9/Knh1-like N-terminal domain-containing protein n=1 Tax=Phanerochaete sordida TaxID=48140 RepID=A0A9P3G6L9_9APHY|nr:hypothetical protein PsYK624_048860 [Phanerochaete sordida]